MSIRHHSWLPGRTVAIAALFAAVTVAATACSGGSSGASGSAAHQIVAGWPSDITTMDPAYMQTDQDKELMMNVYQPLLDYAFVNQNGMKVTQGIKVAPELATAWSLSGNVVTLTIRSGIKFYPSGNPVTAQDAAFSLQRNLNANGKTELNNSGLYKPEQIQAVNDTTLKLTYQTAQGAPITATALQLATLRIPYYGVVDSKVALAHATSSDPYANDWLKSHVVGTGPYYVSNRSLGQSIELTATPNLWSGEPTFKSVRIQVLNNANVSSLLRGGSLNVGLFGVSPSDVNTLKNAGFSIYHANTPDYLYLQMAEDSGPFSNQLVRQAVANAIPYDQITNNVFYGNATRADSFTSIQGQGYTPAWHGYGDPTKAKQLMAQAGNPKISTALHYSNDDASYESTALLIKNALAPLGITVQLAPTTSAAMFSLIIARAQGQRVSPDDGLVLHNLSVYIEDPKGPVSFWSMPNVALNWQRYNNAEVTRLQNQYALAPIDDARAQAYVRIQNLLAADASFVPIEVTGRTIVTTSSIKTPAFQPEIGIRYWELTSG